MAAEQFTGQPGSTVPLKETIEAFDKLAKGDFDHLPEQAFFLIGGLEDLQKKAESLGAKMDDTGSDGAPASDEDTTDDDAEDDDAKDGGATDDDAKDADAAKVKAKKDDDGDKDD
jgi:F-type H+/Na+-transporting ATPase subunit beta